MSDKLNGVIRADEAYSKSMVLQRLKISQKTWDILISEGLPYSNVGHSRWVTGADLIEFMKKRSNLKKAGAV